MGKFILGILFTISVATTCNYHWMINGTFEAKAFWFNNQIIEGNYLIFPFTGRCSEDKIMKTDRGVITAAKWFDCDSFQKWLNRD